MDFELVLLLGLENCFVDHLLCRVIVLGLKFIGVVKSMNT